MFSPRRLSFMPTVCCGPSWSSWPGGQEPSQTAPPLLRPQDFEFVERNSERMGVEFDPHGFCHVLSQDGEYHGIPRKFMKIPCEWWLLLQNVRFCKIQFCAPALCPLWDCLACGTPKSSRSLCFSHHCMQPPHRLRLTFRCLLFITQSLTHSLPHKLTQQSLTTHSSSLLS